MKTTRIHIIAVAVAVGLTASPALGAAGFAPSAPLERTGPAPESCQLSLVRGSERLMVRLVNGHRARARVGRLAVKPLIRTAARRHSRWMARTGNFSHETSLRWGRSRAAGQNLARGRSTRVLVQAMMRSRAHRANLLSTSYQSIGIGGVRTCDGTVFYTINLLG